MRQTGGHCAEHGNKSYQGSIPSDLELALGAIGRKSPQDPTRRKNITAVPTHRKLYRLFQDCERTLAPEVADQFEREANNLARFALFKGDAYLSHTSEDILTAPNPA